MNLVKTIFKHAPINFRFGETILSGFEQLDKKFSLSQLAPQEQEIYIINFFRVVYFKLAKKFKLSLEWSSTAPIPAEIKKQLAEIPRIHWHYFKEIEKLQKKLLG